MASAQAPGSRTGTRSPHTWATPWSAQVVWAKTAGPLYEYACHEANYGMKNNLSGARAVEKKAVEEVANKPAN